MKQQWISDLSPCCYVFPGQDFMKAEPADSLRTPVRHLVMTTCANLMYPSEELNPNGFTDTQNNCNSQVEVYGIDTVSLLLSYHIFVDKT